MADFDIQMKLTMLDEASKQVKSVIDAMSSLGKNAEDINKKFTAMNEAFDKFASAATGSGTRFSTASRKAAESAKKAATDISQAHAKMATETAKQIGKVTAATTRMVKAATDAEVKIINAINGVTKAGTDAVDKSIKALQRLNAAQGRVAQAAVDSVSKISAQMTRMSAATTRYTTRLNNQMSQFSTNATAAQGRITTATNRMATSATRAATRIASAQNAIARSSMNVVNGTNLGTQGLNNMASAAARLRQNMGGVNSSLKGMIALWEAAKIEHFGKSSVDNASDFQQGYMKLRGQGLSDTEARDQMRRSLNTPDRIPYATPLQGLEGRVAAIGGLGHYNPKIVNTTSDQALRTASMLKMMYPEMGDEKDIIRNLYGVAEMRQQTNDPAAMLRTFQLVAKSVQATGGKIRIGDVETAMRQMKIGASTISDDGLRNLIALLDQAKVAGGEGGGGRGVATIGTAYNTMQAYAMGRAMPHRAAEMFVGAGLMGPGTIGQKGVKTGQQRPGPMRDAAMLSTDLPGWLMKYGPNIVDYVKAHQKEFFPNGENPNNQAAMEAAIQSWWAKTGLASTAVGMGATAMEPRSSARIQQQAEQAKSAASTDDLEKMQKDSYVNNVKEFTAAWQKLKIVLGAEILPVVTAVTREITTLVTWLARAFQGDSTAAKLTVLTGAFYGLRMAIYGARSMFGILGTALTTTGARAITMSTMFGGAMSRVRGAVAAGLIYSNSFGAGVARMATGVAGAGSRIATAFMFVGRSVLRIIPFFGQLLLAWDMMKLLGNIRVGGLKISTWITNWLDGLLAKFHKFWNGVMSIFRSTEAVAKAAEEQKERETKTKVRQEARIAADQKEQKGDGDLPANVPPPGGSSVPGTPVGSVEDASDKRLKKLMGGGTGLGPEVHYGQPPKAKTPKKTPTYDQAATDAKEQYREESHEMELQLRLLALQYRKGELGIKEYYDRKDAIIRSGTAKELASLYKERDALAKHTDNASKSRLAHVKTLIKERELDRDEKLEESKTQKKADQLKLEEAIADLDQKTSSIEGKTKQARLKDLEKEIEMKRQLFTVNHKLAELAKLDQYKKKAEAGINFDEVKQKILDIQDWQKNSKEKVGNSTKLTDIGKSNKNFAIDQEAARQMSQYLDQLRQLAAASGDPKLTRWVNDLEAGIRNINKELPPMVASLKKSFEGDFSNFFKSLAEHPKDIKKAFGDLFKSIEGNITDLISKNLSQQLMKSLFGDGDNPTGFSSILSKLFGGGGGGAGIVDDGLGGGNIAGLVPSFDVGTANVTSDMLAQVHSGEAIIPKSFAEGLRSGTMSLGGGGSNMSVQNHFHITGGADQRTQHQIATSAAQALQRAMLRNG